MEDFISRAKERFRVEPLNMMAGNESLSSKMMEFTPESQNLDVAFAKRLIAIRLLPEFDIWKDLCELAERYGHMVNQNTREQAIEAARAENPAIPTGKNMPTFLTRL